MPRRRHAATPNSTGESACSPRKLHPPPSAPPSWLWPLETGPGRWDDEAVNPFFDFLSHYWWLVFPLSGLAGGWARSWSRASEQRHRRRVELYRLQSEATQAEQASQT